MIYAFGEFTLDTALFELRCQGEPVAIEPQVFSILELLIGRRDRVIPRDELFDVIWKGRIVSDAALSSRIRDARRAIGDDGAAQRLIRTVARRGFRFVGEVHEAMAPERQAETAVLARRINGGGPADVAEPAAPSAPVERRHAALMAGDIADFMRLVAGDETGVMAALTRIWVEIVRPSCDAHGGLIRRRTSDLLLVEFPSADRAVRCAMAIQDAVAARGGPLLRLGINAGEVFAAPGDVFGDGVNLATLLKSVAEPGGIAISGQAHQELVEFGAAFRCSEPREVRHVDRPVEVWVWRPARLPPTAPVPALPDRPSIVVLPFETISPEAAHAYLADGVVEAITASLSRIRSFFVIARSSAFAYKGRAVDVRAIGRELGVAYLLEGSVQVDGVDVRITVQLNETTTGAHLWAERYDGRLSHLFELQDRITEQVAGALQPSIRQAEIERARRKAPQDLGAHDYAMRALEHVWLIEKDGAARGLELLDAALSIDPGYPLARALAAWCWAQRAIYNWTDDIAEARARALALADRAAEAAPDDPVILAVLGTVHTFARNFGVARVLLERAVAIDPNAAWAHSRLGWLDVYADRPEPARARFERAIRLSPLDPMNFNNLVGLACAHQVGGDDAAAAELFERALLERPKHHWIYRNYAPALLGAGRAEDARLACERLLETHPGFSIKKLTDAVVFTPATLRRISDQLRTLGVPEA